MASSLGAICEEEEEEEEYAGHEDAAAEPPIPTPPPGYCREIFDIPMITVTGATTCKTLILEPRQGDQRLPQKTPESRRQLLLASSEYREENVPCPVFQWDCGPTEKQEEVLPRDRTSDVIHSQAKELGESQPDLLCPKYSDGSTIAELADTELQQHPRLCQTGDISNSADAYNPAQTSTIRADTYNPDGKNDKVRQASHAETDRELNNCKDITKGIPGYESSEDSFFIGDSSSTEGGGHPQVLSGEDSVDETLDYTQDPQELLNHRLTSGDEKFCVSTASCGKMQEENGCTDCRSVSSCTDPGCSGIVLQLTCCTPAAIVRNRISDAMSVQSNSMDIRSESRGIQTCHSMKNVVGCSGNAHPDLLSAEGDAAALSVVHLPQGTSEGDHQSKVRDLAAADDHQEPQADMCSVSGLDDADMTVLDQDATGHPGMVTDLNLLDIGKHGLDSPQQQVRGAEEQSRDADGGKDLESTSSGLAHELHAQQCTVPKDAEETKDLLVSGLDIEKDSLDSACSMHLLESSGIDSNNENVNNNGNTMEDGTDFETHSNLGKEEKYGCQHVMLDHTTCCYPDTDNKFTGCPLADSINPPSELPLTEDATCKTLDIDLCRSQISSVNNGGLSTGIYHHVGSDSNLRKTCHDKEQDCVSFMQTRTAALASALFDDTLFREAALGYDSGVILSEEAEEDLGSEPDSAQKSGFTCRFGEEDGDNTTMGQSGSPGIVASCEGTDNSIDWPPASATEDIWLPNPRDIPRSMEGSHSQEWERHTGQSHTDLNTAEELPGQSCMDRVNRMIAAVDNLEQAELIRGDSASPVVASHILARSTEYGIGMERSENILDGSNEAKDGNGLLSVTKEIHPAVDCSKIRNMEEDETKPQVSRPTSIDIIPSSVHFDNNGNPLDSNGRHATIIIHANESKTGVGNRNSDKVRDKTASKMSSGAVTALDSDGRSGDPDSSVVTPTVMEYTRIIRPKLIGTPDVSAAHDEDCAGEPGYMDMKVTYYIENISAVSATEFKTAGQGDNSKSVDVPDNSVLLLHSRIIEKQALNDTLGSGSRLRKFKLALRRSFSQDKIPPQTKSKSQCSSSRDQHTPVKENKWISPKCSQEQEQEESNLFEPRDDSEWSTLTTYTIPDAPVPSRKFGHKSNR